MHSFMNLLGNVEISETNSPLTFVSTVVYFVYLFLEYFSFLKNNSLPGVSISFKRPGSGK